MNLLEQGYWVIYEDRALAFTEAPVNMNGLMRQRFRWSFGILQAIFKHRGAIAQTPRDGPVCAAQYAHLPDPAAAGLAA